MYRNYKNFTNILAIDQQSALQLKKNEQNSLISNKDLTWSHTETVHMYKASIWCISLHLHKKSIDMLIVG